MNNRDLLSGKLDELLAFLKHSSMTPFAFRLIYNDVIAYAPARTRRERRANSSDMKDMYDIFSLSGCQSVDDLDELLRRLCDAILSKQKKPVTDPPEEDRPGIEEVASIHAASITPTRSCPSAPLPRRSAYRPRGSRCPSRSCNRDLPERIPGDSSRRALQSSC